MNTLSSHVLDTTLGKPVASLQIELRLPSGQIIEALTDNDGRCNNWQGTEITAGEYQMRFATGDYLKQQHGSSFYPCVEVTFMIEPDSGHYHIPLLISPYGFSSYRGS